MSSPKEEEKPLDETRDHEHADGDNDEVRHTVAAGPAAAPSQKSKRGG
jgi:hypothetical protein